MEFKRAYIEDSTVEKLLSASCYNSKTIQKSCSDDSDVKNLSSVNSLCTDLIEELTKILNSDLEPH